MPEALTESPRNIAPYRHARPAKETVTNSLRLTASSIALRNGACLVPGSGNVPTTTKRVVDPPTGANPFSLGNLARMGIVDDVGDAAQWMAEALTSSKYLADFAPSSLWEIERFFEEQAPDGQARARGLLSEGLGTRLFGVGA